MLQTTHHKFAERVATAQTCKLQSIWCYFVTFEGTKHVQKMHITNAGETLKKNI